MNTSPEITFGSEIQRLKTESNKNSERTPTQFHGGELNFFAEANPITRPKPHPSNPNPNLKSYNHHLATIATFYNLVSLPFLGYSQPHPDQSAAQAAQFGDATLPLYLQV
uniref:Uncharacterized protein n=1 Tax=Kalanchoe fedtschenkoi TaxID=63787 RepID=A0A7N0U787_KALFE